MSLVFLKRDLVTSMSISKNLSGILRRYYKLIYRWDCLAWRWVSFSQKAFCEIQPRNALLRKVSNGGLETERLGAISLKRASKFLLAIHVCFAVKLLKESLAESRGYLIKPRLASFDGTPKKSLSWGI